MRKIVFGISGASGIPLAHALLDLYRQVEDLEINLIVSDAARVACAKECGFSADKLELLAHHVYPINDLAGTPASGSWQNEGMIICPCSMSSLAAIANGCGTNLLHRAADVALKERRPLIMATRETPLNLVHLRNMAAATEAGAIIMPFMPSFYIGDESLAGIIKNFAGRILDLLKIPNNFCFRWH